MYVFSSISEKPISSLNPLLPSNHTQFISLSNVASQLLLGQRANVVSKKLEGGTSRDDFVYRPDNHLMQKFFLYRSCRTRRAVFFYPAEASPNCGLAPTVVPVDSAEDVITVGTVHDARKSVSAAVNPALLIRSALHVCPTVHFFTHLHELLTGNNGGMTVLDIVLRNDAVIRNTFFIKEIHRIGLLQECITDVFLVCEDLLQRTLQPVITSGGGLDAVRFQPLSNLEQACTFQILSIDSQDDFRFFRDDDQVAFIVL